LIIKGGIMRVADEIMIDKEIMKCRSCGYKFCVDAVHLIKGQNREYRHQVSFNQTCDSHSGAYCFNCGEKMGKNDVYTVEDLNREIEQILKEEEE
jgi:uncharacterized Zn finger protein